ncbi:copper transporter 4-like [Rhododendron vialii]|uniref:copper transporter 4-like n=1 Tax=Rhododendron vialii TaxID=182163 RepID=UPI00266026EC|nr:copper transporter 4-like [Rhododendron vialii]
MKNQPQLHPTNMEIMHHNIRGALPMAAWYNATAGHVHHRSVLMHVAFYWGKNAEFLFSGWPGSSTVMYALALIFVFGLAVLVEWLSHCEHIKPGANRVASGLFQTGIHAVRAGFVYMVILAVMSYNGGVFIAAVLGHAVGFSLFGSRVLKELRRTSDLPMSQ